MSLFTLLLVAGATFGVCFFFDKGYTRYFRSQAQHKSGLSVRYSKRYASFGLILVILGILAVFTGITGGMGLLIGGIVVALMGVGLILYYMTFGVFYDADSFLLTTRRSKSRTYRFSDIKAQQLYVLQGGNVIIELHLTDGNAVSLHSAMEGVYPFLDHAFYAWCRQKSLAENQCDFHDPANSCWFPPVEEA